MDAPRHTFREDGSHYNGGPDFFGYGYLAVGEPRLKMVRKWFKRGTKRGTSEDSFHVDGEKVENYQAALEALKTPPVFSEGELEALRQIGDEAADWRKLIPYEVLYSLRSKGAIEYEMGRCRRTDAGRAALS